MKYTLLCFHNKWRKLITDAGFWLSMFFILLLCTSSVIYMDTTKNDAYSVWLSLVSFDRDFMLENIDFSSVIVLSKITTGYLAMFIPMVAPFAIVRLICGEQESGVIRFEIVRCGKLRYHLTNFISGVLSGGIITALGFIVYGVLIYFLFPSFDMYSPVMQSDLIEMYEMGYGITLQTDFPLLLAEKLPMMFLYGVFASMPAIALTSILRNPYTVLCLPFFFNYALTQLTTKMMGSTDFEKLPYIQPSAWLEFSDKSALHSAILMRCIILLILAMFYLLVQNFKTDRGA